MEDAAKYVTPVTLELGGKNPCIVDREIDMEKTARRIVWGKFFNAGQTCLAPDYLLIHRSLKTPLLTAIKTTIEHFYGPDPSRSTAYGRIINEQHFNRLMSLLQGARVVIGGETDSTTLYIPPTVIDDVTWEDPVMADEIFGPLLPVITYEDLDEIIARLRARPKPLALYFFSRDKGRQRRIIHELSAGGVSINDTLGHFENGNLPFGGVGESGVGAYHKKASFETFTHWKSVLRRSFLSDPGMKYPPYTIPLRYLKKGLECIY